MPTFEQKTEALHWFPMFRPWFGLCGLCKPPWNDIVPEDNKDMENPAKVSKHVECIAQYFTAVSGRNVKPDELITTRAAVYKPKGWTNNAIPKFKAIQRLGLDLPEVLAYLNANEVK